MDRYDAASLILTLLVVLLTAVYLRFRRPPGFPPGPSYLPWLGTAAFMSSPSSHKELIALLRSWSHHYGKVCGYSTGDRWGIIVNDYEIAKEMFIHNGKYVSDRVQLLHQKATNPYYPKTGILSGNFTDEGWGPMSHACQMALHHLVDIPPQGRSTSRMEGRMARPLDVLLGRLDFMRGDSSDLTLPFTDAVLQFFMSMLFGDNEKELKNCSKQLVLVREPLATYRDHIHITENYLHEFLSMFMASGKQFVLDKKAFNSFIFSMLGEHETQDKKDQLQTRDFIDSYKRERTKSGSDDDDRLFLVLSEILEHGVDPLISTIRWIMYYLATQPELQARMQSAIDSVVGPKRQPRLKDRPLLGLVDAVINETLRIAPPFLVSEAHVTSSKIEAGGFLVPKNTMVFLNIWHIHHDSKLWTEPGTFNPDRFLNSSGRFVNKREMVAFGMGRRMCIGEQVARQLLFLLVATLFRRFTFMPPDGLSAADLLARASDAKVYQAPPFVVKAVRRATH